MLNLVDQHAAGLGLVCDREGTVLHILRDDLGVAAARSLGKSFSLLVDRGSFTKALFTRSIKVSASDASLAFANSA